MLNETLARPIVRIAAFFLANLFSAFTASASSSTECADDGLYLFISSKSLRHMHAYENNLIGSKFNRCNVIVGGSRDVLRKTFDIGLKVRKRTIYKSINEFLLDIKAGRLSGAVQIVVYNPEPGFENTPEHEKREPVSSAIMFAEIAKANKLLSVAAPSCNLMKEREVRKKYSSCSNLFFKPIAPYFDFIDIQSQETQSNPQLYANIVREISLATKAINPNLKVVSQLTTVDARGGNSTTIGEAAKAAKPYVDGFWINIDNKSADGETDFLGFMKLYSVY